MKLVHKKEEPSDFVNSSEMERITSIVCNRLNVSIQDVKKPDGAIGARKAPLVRARQMSMVFCYKIYGAYQTQVAIGDFFGRNHATVSHALVSSSGDYDSDENYRKVFEEIKRIIVGTDGNEWDYTWEMNPLNKNIDDFAAVKNQL